MGDAPNSQISASGPNITLPPQTALHLALVLHELGTNARKHGALSTPAGGVDVRWSEIEREGERLLHLRWQETGGPAVSAPQSKGFGLSLIEGSLRGKNAQVDLRFERSGVVCEILMPLATPRHDHSGS